MTNDEKILIKGIFEKKIKLRYIISLIILFILLIIGLLSLEHTLVIISIVGIFITIGFILVYYTGKFELICTNEKIYINKNSIGLNSKKEIYIDTIIEIKIIKNGNLFGDELIIKTSNGNTTISTEYGQLQNAEKIKEIVMQQKKQSLNSKTITNTEIKSEDISEKLIKIKKLLDENIITEEEYENKRKDLINKI